MYNQFKKSLTNLFAYISNQCEKSILEMLNEVEVPLRTINTAKEPDCAK